MLGEWGPSGTRVVASELMWKEPLKWDRRAKKAGVRMKVFCASLADVFEEWSGPMLSTDGRVIVRPYLDSDNVPANWQLEFPETLLSDPQGWRPITMGDVRKRLFDLILATPYLDWLLLTKRPENAVRYAHANGTVLYPQPNLWLGTSVENQAAADERIPELLKVPAVIRFLSCEPLLGPVDLDQWLFTSCKVCGGYPTTARPCHCGSDANQHPGISSVIVGGESGRGARPMNPDWVRSLRDQCQAAGVAFFFKQWGEWCGGEDFYSGISDDVGPTGLYADLQNRTVLHESKVRPKDWKSWVEEDDDETPNDAVSIRVGKKAAGRLLDGRTWDEFPVGPPVSLSR